jgi:hypothetical protein
MYHGSSQSMFNKENRQQMLADDARTRIPFAEDFVPA